MSTEKSIEIPAEILEYMQMVREGEHPVCKEQIQLVDMLENRGESLEDVVCDYISGMTDQYAIQKFQEYFVPRSWS